MDNRPIGFLDSGVGGLTVVRELKRQLPHESIVYIGDSARAPYGPRPVSYTHLISIFQSIVDLFLTWLRLAKSKGYPSWQRHFPMSLLTIKQLRQMAISL